MSGALFNTFLFNTTLFNQRTQTTHQIKLIPEYIEVRDPATDKPVAFLSPESDGLKECWVDDEQNGACTLEFELPLACEKWQYLTDKYRIYADDKEFVILNPDAVDKQRDGKKLTGKIKAHESWVLLGKKYQTISNDQQNPSPPWGAVIIVSGGAAHGGFDPGSAGSALSYLLQGTGWTVGTVDVTGTYDLETEKESVLYNINQVQEKWGGILIWDSINKTVSLRDEATYKPYTGYQIRYAKNLKGITRTDDYDIVTRLYPFGENDLNIANVNGGLLYLDNHSYSDDILEGVWYNQDLADQTQLKLQGERQLAVMCRPRHNYKTEVLDLRSLPGYGHETFKRSDMVDLLDEDFGANARVRIIRYRHNVFQPWLCDMDLGDPIEKISATVAQTVLMAKFYKNVVKPNESFQNLLKAIINTEATEINGASGDYTLVDGVSTWFDRDSETGELTGKLLRITPQGLIISHDGGQTWKLAISGEGIHAEAGWVGKLNAGVVTIGADTTFEPGYDPVDNHLYFEYSVDGMNWHPIFNSASDLYMRQKVGDNGTWSEPARIAAVDGEDGYTPVKGVDYFDGVDGQDGADGTSSYLWVRYSQNSNGNPMTTDPTGAVYIGIATTTTPSAPTSYTAYSWSLIKGQDGVPGEAGADGKTSYLHIKYSDDGVNFTGNGGEDVGAYIGTYVDFNPVDSMNFNDYTWNKVKGTPIVWKGELASPPSNPEENWVYRDTDNGYVYIYNGTAWELMVTDGADGIDGAPGVDGMSVYITYHNNPTDSQPATPTGDGTSGGWYTAPSAQANWMSQKVATNAYSGTWGAPILISGGRKFTSQPVPPYDVGDLWIGGSDGQNTLICTTARSSGSFVASDWERMTEPVANMGVDADCLGLWHFDGSLNSHKGVSATFTRASVAYLEDGTQVASGVPRFEVGKFGRGVLIEEGTTNLLSANQSSIETDTTGLGSQYSATITRDTTEHWNGSASLKVVTPGTRNIEGFSASKTGMTLVVGDKYTASAWVKGTGTVFISLAESGSAFARTDGIPVTLTNAWQRITVTRTITNAANTTLALYVWTYGAQAVTFYADGLQLEQKPYATRWQLGGTARTAEVLTIPTAGVLSPQEGTWGLWVYVDSMARRQVANQWPTIFRIPGVSSAGIWLYHDNDTATWGLLTQNDVGTTSMVECSDSYTPDGWHYFAVAWKSGEIALFIDGVRRITITNPNMPSGFAANAYIGSYAGTGDFLNTVIDELRIDKVCRTDEEIAGWYKANAPFYTSEDMKQWPGYVKVETDGLKVYDSSDDLRVLIGSWLRDMVRKYGIKIIEGEFYSSFIQTGEEGETRGIVKIDREFLEHYPDFSWGNITFNDSAGNLAIEMNTAHDAPRLTFYLDGVRAGELYLSSFLATGEIVLSSERGLLLSAGTGENIKLGATGGQTSNTGIKLYSPSSISLESIGYVSMSANYDEGSRAYVDGYEVIIQGNKIYLVGAAQVTGNLHVGGTVHANGDLEADGNKPAIIPTVNYGRVRQYAIESPEIILLDRGRAQLENGKAIIYIDPIHLECIEPDTDETPWTFKTEVYGEGEDIRVIEWGENYFKVKECNNGTSNRLFGWWFYATRKNYAGIRLMEVTN